jgi:SAM-dependent methyltransferase
MSAPTARYDAIADWYREFTKDWVPQALGILPDNIRDERILDLACGYGQVSRALSRRGAAVTGVDLSSDLLAHAASVEAEESLGIQYLQGDVTTTAWWDGRPFDGVLCNMALMDIDDLDGALGTVAAVLKPGGWFSFSIFHPCYPGGPEGSASGLPSWPPDLGYASEGWWMTDGEGVRGRVGANHRRLSTYLNAVVRSGLDFEEFAEPRADVPLYLMARCRKPG